MTAPDEMDADELALLSRLRELFDAADPVPPDTVIGAQSLFGLRRLDEELAELVRDSAEERDRLLGVRGERIPDQTPLARQAPAGLLGIHINLAATVPPEIAMATTICFRIEMPPYSAADGLLPVARIS